MANTNSYRQTLQELTAELENISKEFEAKKQRLETLIATMRVHLGMDGNQVVPISEPASLTPVSAQAERPLTWVILDKILREAKTELSLIEIHRRANAGGGPVLSKDAVRTALGRRTQTFVNHKNGYYSLVPAQEGNSLKSQEATEVAS